MHFDKVFIQQEQFPTRDYYPYSLPLFQNTSQVIFDTPVTFFCGANGTGKTTLLTAICQKCGVYIWEGEKRQRAEPNPFEKSLPRAIGVQWVNGRAPGSFFSPQNFTHFSKLLDEWEAQSPGSLTHFGGKSLLNQSHGQSLMSYFTHRYRIPGVYFLDEPETALSPKSQIELLSLLHQVSQQGHAQFVIASHSPILLACPGARILSFDGACVEEVNYKETDTYCLYRDFMTDVDGFLENMIQDG